MIDRKKIKRVLPRRYSKELQKRVHSRTGRLYSISTIVLVMRDTPVLENTDILEEAALWAQEIKERKERTSKITSDL